MAIVFCHGAFESQQHWSDYAQRMHAQGYPAFTFDFTGHGESQGTPSLVDLRVWAYNIRDALTHLQAMGYQRFALVGWDIGGSAALLATAHDQRLNCAVILAAPLLLQPPLTERIAYGLATGAAKIKKAILKKPLTLSRLNELEELQMTSDEEANAIYCTNEGIRASYSAIPIPESLNSVWMDISNTVGKVKVPVLVMHGMEDRIIRMDQSQSLYDKLPVTKQLKKIKGCGHALHLDREKDDVFAHLAKWIRQYS